MKIQPINLLRLAGAIWLAVGFSLMYKGVHYLLDGSDYTFAGIENGIVIVLAVAFFIGYLKGRRILNKVVDREVGRLASIKTPTTLFNLYSRGQCILLIGMICLGISMRFIGLDPLTRGFIDVAIGTALIHGAMHYLRSSFIYGTETP